MHDATQSLLFKAAGHIGGLKKTIFIILCLVSFSFACGTLGTPNTVYTLTNDTSIYGATCFNVTAQNVTLNCAGYDVVGNNTTGTYGVYSNQFNTTLKYCNITKFFSAVFFNGATGGKIEYVNATGISTYTLLNLIESDGNLIDNVNISAMYLGHALSSIDSKNNVINNSFFEIHNQSYTGIYLLNVNNTSVLNTKLWMFDQSGGNGIEFYGDSVLIKNVMIYDNGTTDSFGAGMWIDGNNSIVSNVSVFSEVGISFLIDNVYSYSNFSITDSTFISNGSVYTGYIADVSNLTFANNIIKTNSSKRNGLKIYSYNSSYINNTFIALNNYVSFIQPFGENNTFYWNNFTNTSGLYVNDTNGNNHYNYSSNGVNKGNIWFNVINGSVNITGSISSPWAGLYYGSAGTGYPYNDTNSLGKVTSGVIDYAPLTPSYLPIAPTTLSYYDACVSNYTQYGANRSYLERYIQCRIGELIGNSELGGLFLGLIIGGFLLTFLLFQNTTIEAKIVVILPMIILVSIWAGWIMYLLGIVFGLILFWAVSKVIWR